MTEIFKAIGDSTRQQILVLLEQGPKTVTEIVEKFALAQPTISRHLAVLRQAGLVESERQGQHVVYSLRESTINRLCARFFGQFSCCAEIFGKKDS
ncbi:MAG: winged helix-turn-helix transcriptional regulator [Candidatus Schekmanbacteria bacterium]|nr:winged helix-turn-helix transcriptional regulator [Candidatus Schekmanbacteria bacterium]